MVTSEETQAAPAVTGRRVELWLPGPLPPSQNAMNAMGKWERIKSTRDWRVRVALACREHWGVIRLPLPYARVTMTLYRREGVKPRDRAGLYGSVKAAEDGLLAAHGGRLLVDDSDEHCDLLVRQEVAATPALAGVWIVVEEVLE